jgi:hypothetical protein
MRCDRVLLLLGALLGAAQGVKILGLFAVSGKSHNNFFSALTTELSRRGHDLTVVTSYPSGYSAKNYKEIQVDTMEQTMQGNSFSPFDLSEMSPSAKLTKLLGVFLEMCPAALTNKKVLKLPAHFFLDLSLQNS